MATVTTYDPKNITIAVGGVIVTGYADDTFVHLEFDEDRYMLKVGVDGTATRSRSRNGSAKLTLTLLGSSPTNDALTALHVADLAANAGMVPFLMRDANGASICTALNCWLTKLPALEFGKEPGNRAWVFQTDNAQMTVGGQTL